MGQTSLVKQISENVPSVPEFPSPNSRILISLLSFRDGHRLTANSHDTTSGIAFAAHRSDDTDVGRRRGHFMNFVSKLFGGNSPLGEQPVRLGHFDIAGWEDVERSPNSVYYRTPDNVAVSINWDHFDGYEKPDVRLAVALRRAMRANMPKDG